MAATVPDRIPRRRTRSSGTLLLFVIGTVILAVLPGGNLASENGMGTLGHHAPRVTNAGSPPTPITPTGDQSTPAAASRCADPKDSRAPVCTSPSSAPQWVWALPQSAPPPAGPARVDGESMTYDPNAGGALLFGGYDLSFFSGQTWLFAGGHWTEQTLTSSPSARANAAMVFDPADNETILFGGNNASYLNDTWSFASGHWSELFPTRAPAPRTFASMIYDPAIGKLVLFGGFGGYSSGAAVSYSDTWTFSAGQWTNVTAPGGPGARSIAGFAYDTADGYAVLYGGSNSLGNPYSDTWNFTNGTWTKMTSAGSPGSRGEVAMAYDDPAGIVQMYGGVDQFGGAGTWYFQAGTWHEYFPFPAPPPSQLPAITYDPALRADLVTGGIGGYGNAAFSLTNETWAVNGTGLLAPSWRLLVAPAEPRPLNGAATTFDALDGYTLLVGGQSLVDGVNSFGAYVGDTWAFSDGSWTLEGPAGNPSARLGPALAYDPAANESILFGGSTNSGAQAVNDTWAYRAGNWTHLSTPRAPSPRWGSLLAYDPSEGGLILFGGTDGGTAFSDSWLFSNGVWTKLTPTTSPPGRAWPSGAWDFANTTLVMFGGCEGVTGGFYGCAGSYVHDTWTFANGTWSQLAPTLTLPSSAGSPMASSLEVPSIPLYGADSGTGTYVYAGGQWSNMTASVSPGYRLFPSMFYDEPTHAFWLAGGNGNGSSVVWELTPPDILQVPVPVASRVVADVGQTLTLSVTISGAAGVPTYTWLGLPGCLSGNVSSLLCTATVQGSFNVHVMVATTSGQVRTSGDLVLTINPALSLGAPTASPSVFYLGATTTIAVLAQGGTPPLTFAWTGLPAGCVGANASVLSCTPAVAGSATPSVTVIDSAGSAVTSSTAHVEADALPAISAPSSSRPSVDVGQSVTFSTTVSGAAGLGVIYWTSLPPGCVSANTSALTCSPSAPGQVVVGAELTYGTGESVTSATSLFEVYSDPFVSAPHASVSPATAGETVTFSVTSSAGSGGDTFSWTGLPAACASLLVPTSTSVTCQVGQGNYSISVSITDSNGFTMNGTALEFPVSAASITRGTPGGGGNGTAAFPFELVVVILVVVAVGAAGALLYAFRRRARPPEEGTDEPTEAAPSEGGLSQEDATGDTSAPDLPDG